MADLLSCLKLTNPLELYLHPTATPDSALHQCLTGSNEPNIEDIGKGLMDIGLLLLGSTGVGRAAGKGAAHIGSRVFRHIPNQLQQNQNPSETQNQNGNTCADPIISSIRVLLGFSNPILLSPIATPESFGLSGQCQHPVNIEKTTKQLSDGIADFLMDRFGPEPGLWLAETFDL